MRPRLARSDFLYRVAPDIKLCGHFSSREAASPNPPNISLGELGLPMLGALWGPATANLIVHVVLMGTA